MSNNDRSRILNAVINNLKSFQREIDRASYDREVRLYFPDSAYKELMDARERGSEAIEEAARRLY